MNTQNKPLAAILLKLAGGLILAVLASAAQAAAPAHLLWIAHHPN
jgi:hypothetical protein